MLEGFASLLSSLRQTSPVIFTGVCIACGTIIFIGDDIANTLGLIEFRDQNRGYLGATFIVSLSIVLAQSLWSGGRFATSVLKKLLEGRKAKQALEKRRKALHDLTPDEKAYLAPYIHNDENTRYFLIEDGIAAGLEAKEIIYKASNIGSILDG